MNNDVIGFKLADGSFYPVFEEGAAVEKQLELTTVRDDQTTIQLHLYKSPTGTMEEARYVETLILENLVPHPKEEPSLSLKIALDNEGNLSAEIIDPETGTSSSTNVSLVTLDEATLHEMETGDSDDGTSEFSVSEGSFTDEAADDMDFSLPEEPAADDMDFSLPEEPAADGVDFSLPDEPAADDIDFSLPENPAADDMDFSLPEEPAADDDFPFSVDSGDAEPATDDTGFDIDDEMPTMSDFKIDDDFAGSDDLSVDTAAASDEAPSFSLSVDDDFSASDFSLPETDDIEESSFDVDFSTDDMDASAGNDEDPFSFNDIPDFGDIPESNNDQNLLDSLDPGNPLAASFGADDSFFEEEERRSQRRVRIPVIICIVCAVISVIVLAIILFLTPSRLKKTECVPETEPVIEVPVTPVEDLTKARENEVVVSPIPVVPEPPKKVVQEPDPTPVQPVESLATAAPKKEPLVTQAPAKKEPQSVRYKLKWGDTLWDLADAYYRNPWQYKKIARWNGIKNPDYIIAGTYIYIPE